MVSAAPRSAMPLPLSVTESSTSSPRSVTRRNTSPTSSPFAAMDESESSMNSQTACAGEV